MSSDLDELLGFDDEGELSPYDEDFSLEKDNEARRVVTSTDDTSLDIMLRALVESGGSDLHIQAHYPPMCRINGEITVLPGFKGVRLDEKYIESVIFDNILANRSREMKDRLLMGHNLNTSYVVGRSTRFRINILQERDAWSLVCREIPRTIRTVAELGLPPVIGDFASAQNGLILFTGPTGSGKTNSMAALVSLINKTRRCHILTLEDPIEFVHNNVKSIVRQREIGADVNSFEDGLEFAMRADPDVILVGEMNSPATIRTALLAAETGHLVISTLHTRTASESISRILGAFPADEQPNIRELFSASLYAIVSQKLCRKIGGGRVPAAEILIAHNKPGIKANLRKGDLAEVTGALSSNALKNGSQTLEMNLADLQARELITEGEAYTQAENKKALASYSSTIRMRGVRSEESDNHYAQAVDTEN